MQGWEPHGKWRHTAAQSLGGSSIFTPIIRSIASAANSFSVFGQPSGRVIMRLGGANGYQKSPWAYHLETIGHANNEIPGAAFSARSPRGSPNDATILVRRPNLQPHGMTHSLGGYLLRRLRATGWSNNVARSHNRTSSRWRSGYVRQRRSATLFCKMDALSWIYP